MTAKWVLIWLCIYPSAKSTGKFQKIAHILFTIVYFMGCVLGALCHFAFLLKNRSTDLNGSIFSFNGSFGFSAMFYVMVTVFSLRSEICAILDQLTTIYDTRKCQKKEIIIIPTILKIYLKPLFFLQVLAEIPNSLAILSRANDRCEWMCKFYINYTIFIVVGNPVMGTVIAIIGLINSKGDFDASHLYHISRAL